MTKKPPYDDWVNQFDDSVDHRQGQPRRRYELDQTHELIQRTRRTDVMFGVADVAFWVACAVVGELGAIAMFWHR